MGITPHIYVFKHFVLCLLIILLLFPTPAYGIDRGLFHRSSPVIDFTSKTVTACSKHLTECPVSDLERKTREICYFGYTGKECPWGQHYGCGVDIDNGFTVEGCFKKNVCPRGSSNRIKFDINAKTAVLVCISCDDHHYQSLPADSSRETLKGCSEKRNSSLLTNDGHTLKLIEKGWPTKADKYSCDVSKNFSDVNGQMYCYVTQPCHCTNYSPCMDPSRPDLLPDRSCDAKCATYRDPLQNYSCSRYVNGSLPPTSTTPLSVLPEKPTDKPNTWPIVVIVVVVIVGGGLIFGLAIRCKRRRIPEVADDHLLGIQPGDGNGQVGPPGDGNGQAGPPREGNGQDDPPGEGIEEEVPREDPPGNGDVQAGTSGSHIASSNISVAGDIYIVKDSKHVAIHTNANGNVEEQAENGDSDPQEPTPTDNDGNQNGDHLPYPIQAQPDSSDEDSQNIATRRVSDASVDGNTGDDATVDGNTGDDDTDGDGVRMDLLKPTPSFDNETEAFGNTSSPSSDTINTTVPKVVYIPDASSSEDIQYMDDEETIESDTFLKRP